jgi:hypothetical protein
MLLVKCYLFMSTQQALINFQLFTYERKILTLKVTLQIRLQYNILYRNGCIYKHSWILVVETAKLTFKGYYSHLKFSSNTSLQCYTISYYYQWRNHYSLSKRYQLVDPSMKIIMLPFQNPFCFHLEL